MWCDVCGLYLYICLPPNKTSPCQSGCPGTREWKIRSGGTLYCAVKGFSSSSSSSSPLKPCRRILQPAVARDKATTGVTNCLEPRAPHASFPSATIESHHSFVHLLSTGSSSPRRSGRHHPSSPVLMMSISKPKICSVIGRLEQ